MKREFKEEDKIKCLLWCDRHCCICKKNCGPDIEVAHIDQKIKGEEVNNINNAIPLCYDCHAKIGHYNPRHPRGNKYKTNELKARREQIYEEFTQHLVPPIDFKITQIQLDGTLRRFPDVGFQIHHLGKGLPVRASVNVDVSIDNGLTYRPPGHYAGIDFWNLNPGFLTQGHFEIPDDLVKDAKRVSAVVSVKIIDRYSRPHELLPMEWVYETEQHKEWWYNP